MWSRISCQHIPIASAQGTLRKFPRADTARNELMSVLCRETTFSQWIWHTQRRQMKSRLTEALLVWLATIHVASSTLTTHFRRDGEDRNDITLTCSGAWEGDIDNAIFLRDGQPLNDEGADKYNFTITQQTEGNFTCYEQGQPMTISARLQLAGEIMNAQL